jgi:hypothetical protein
MLFLNVRFFKVKRKKYELKFVLKNNLQLSFLKMFKGQVQ